MQLSENVSKRGGNVFFAKTKEEATNYIQEVAKKEKCKKSCEIKINGNRRN